eukprot:Plantae.Rhodophyta-Rhodochaete_pulchella.ctg3531.p1 GENE.Plantae.Rhodophyta-Rhodochaete_pulchella.ctg3531~~Plantae.Rhodophyta-Rhodochaete_pulchella.ctg3531.p1  ORF type:complete len:416 (-),score=101.77 Plantae.Rhodophyta-Rhodochaete_pulchella.ctg3531:692-1939(-)
MLTMRTYGEAGQEIEEQLDTATLACEELMGSRKFKQILAVVLCVGNYLNSGTRKGQARGYKFEILAKLTETKARDREVSLLHFVVDLLRRKFPDLLDFAEDLKHSAKAVRIEKSELQAELGSFLKAVSVMGREINAVVQENENKQLSEPSRTPKSPGISGTLNKSSAKNLKSDFAPPSPTAMADEEDKLELSRKVSFREPPSSEENETSLADEMGAAKRCFKDAEESTARLQEKMKKLETTFEKLANYLGEEMRAAKIGEIFGVVQKFRGTFETCLKEIEEREAKKAKEEKRKRLKEEDERKKREEEERKRREEEEAEAIAESERQEAPNESEDSEDTRESTSGSETESNSLPGPLVADDSIDSMDVPVLSMDGMDLSVSQSEHSLDSEELDVQEVPRFPSNAGSDKSASTASQK